MKKTNSAQHIGQAMYLGRWVDKSTFRAFVYNDKEQKLAKSYDEFESLIASGLWRSEKMPNASNIRKRKDDTNS